MSPRPDPQAPDLLPWTHSALGATLLSEADGGGVCFAVFADGASRVELCLFPPLTPAMAADPDHRASIDQAEEIRLSFAPATVEGVFQGRLVGNPFGAPAGAGLRYAFRIHGPWTPSAGQRFNPDKLVLDPMARALDGPFHPDQSLFGHHPPSEDALAQDERAALLALAPDPTPNYRALPRCVVCAPLRPAQALTRRPWIESVVYESHVKGLTRLLPEVPGEHQGRFSGLAHPALISHLTGLGVSALELLPVTACLDEPHLWPLGLTNYWGYNPAVLAAPDPSMGSPESLRDAIGALHEAGIEVILDVVFNHGAEGGILGPAVSFRGLGERAWYRSHAEDPLSFHNDSGCGNVINLDHPMVLRQVMDALRRWVSEYGVDGFRFDLCATLGRSFGPFDPVAPLLSAITQDPVLRGVRLIAEPWDIGPGGYQAGAFLPPWMEWNDAYRDAVRAFWLTEGGGDAAAMATALAGSSNRFQGSGRRPSASVNFVTCHDGFTLADLTAYGQKHNHANGEDNRDGSDHEGSRNFGHEGPVESSHPDRREIEARRLRARRALLGSLFLSLGVPMLCAGDEIGRSQHGNNNAYCQDSPLSWIDWSAADQDLLRFCRSCIDLRRRLDQFQRDRWLSPETDVLWRAPDGALLEGEAWGHARGAFAMQLRGNGDGPDVLVLMNAREESVDFTLPDGQAWECVLSADPARPTPSPSGRRSLPATDLKVFLSVG